MVERCPATQDNLECKLPVGHKGQHRSLQDAWWGWNAVNDAESSLIRELDSLRQQMNRAEEEYEQTLIEYEAIYGETAREAYEESHL